jgi:hypothetical protein
VSADVHGGIGPGGKIGNSCGTTAISEVPRWCHGFAALLISAELVGILAEAASNQGFFIRELGIVGSNPVGAISNTLC